MKRPNVLAVHSIDHFALEVPDLVEARRFYDAFGLDVRDEADGLALYTFGNAHCWGRLRRAAAKRLNYICFGIYAEDEAAFAAHLDAAGVTRIAAPAGGGVAVGFKRRRAGMAAAASANRRMILNLME